MLEGPIAYGKYHDFLGGYEQEVLRQALNRCATIHVGDIFEIGKVSADNWIIQSRLDGAEGHFNRGVFIVNHSHPEKGPGIMKLLSI
jgi:hypothetical protein